MRRFLFSSMLNTSSTTEPDTTRYLNEYLLIRNHFFENMDTELFLRTFHSYFRNPDATTPEEFLCEQAFLLCDCNYGGKQNPILGILKLTELLACPKTADVLESSYHFTPISYMHSANDTFSVTHLFKMLY